MTNATLTKATGALKTGKSNVIVILPETASLAEQNEVFKKGYGLKLRGPSGDRVLTIQESIDSIIESLYPKQPNFCQCRECGRTLTDPTSVSLGIGPECRKSA